VPKQAPIRAGERKIKIDELDNLARGAFKVWNMEKSLYHVVVLTDAFSPL
jgi:hypothetical protein